MIPSAQVPARPRPGGASLPIRVQCTGCGYELGAEPLQLACPRSRPGDDIDHVLTRLLDPDRLLFPAGQDPNPFVRYRTLFYAYHRACAAGRSDAEVVELVHRLDARVASVDGDGFAATPFTHSPALAGQIGHGGEVWIKDETGNVSGSHKSRHLFGTLLALELAAGEWRSGGRTLAIASCGNAALAAAVVARAADLPLRVFIPADAEPGVPDRLRELDADVVVCQRTPGEAGDPTYRSLLAAVADGAIPFTCQGNQNWLAIEGGLTLGWEIVSDLIARRARLDHLVIQVGGGALASSCIQALTDAHRLGALARPPRIHTVQTSSAAPLARAVRAVLDETGPQPVPATVGRVLDQAAQHRSRFMWPWESVPHSIAGGILDDETYDWLAVVRGMLLTDGLPLVVGEQVLADANRLAREATGIDADHTGTAGVAGLIELLRSGEVGPNQSVAVILTGVRRRAPANGGHP